MEALALGVPAVATRVGGVAELVTDGIDAVLVPPGEPSLLADALVALALDPARRAALANAATERAEALDATAAVREIEAVYREAVGR